MPQKKNPDIAELVRGKTGRVYGALTSILTTMKGIPLAYNKDMQEDKEPVFDAIDTAKICLQVFAPMIREMKANEENMMHAAQKDLSTRRIWRITLPRRACRSVRRTKSPEPSFPTA